MSDSDTEIVLNMKSFLCEKCEKVFENKHQLDLHSNQCKKGVTCEICGKVYARLYGMQRHFKKHHGDKKLPESSHKKSESSHSKVNKKLLDSARTEDKSHRQRVKESKKDGLNKELSKKGNSPQRNVKFVDKASDSSHATKSTKNNPSETEKKICPTQVHKKPHSSCIKKEKHASKQTDEQRKRKDSDSKSLTKEKTSKKTPTSEKVVNLVMEKDNKKTSDAKTKSPGQKKLSTSPPSHEKDKSKHPAKVQLNFKDNLTKSEKHQSIAASNNTNDDKINENKKKSDNIEKEKLQPLIVKQMFECKMCSKSFMSRMGLNQHEKRSHTFKSPQKDPSRNNNSKEIAKKTLHSTSAANKKKKKSADQLKRKKNFPLKSSFKFRKKNLKKKFEGKPKEKKAKIVSQIESSFGCSHCEMLFKDHDDADRHCTQLHDGMGLAIYSARLENESNEHMDQTKSSEQFDSTFNSQMSENPTHDSVLQIEDEYEQKYVIDDINFEPIILPVNLSETPLRVTSAVKDNLHERLLIPDTDISIQKRSDSVNNSFQNFKITLKSSKQRIVSDFENNEEEMVSDSSVNLVTEPSESVPTGKTKKQIASIEKNVRFRHPGIETHIMEPLGAQPEEIVPVHSLGKMCVSINSPKGIRKQRTPEGGCSEGQDIAKSSELRKTSKISSESLIKRFERSHSDGKSKNCEKQMSSDIQMDLSMSACKNVHNNEEGTSNLSSLQNSVSRSDISLNKTPKIMLTRLPSYCEKEKSINVKDMILTEQNDGYKSADNTRRIDLTKSQFKKAVEDTASDFLMSEEEDEETAAVIAKKVADLRDIINKRRNGKFRGLIGRELSQFQEEKCLANLPDMNDQHKSDDQSKVLSDEPQTEIADNELSKNPDQENSDVCNSELKLTVQIHSSSQTDYDTPEEQEEASPNTTDTSKNDTEIVKVTLNSQAEEINQNSVVPVKKRGRPKKGKEDQTETSLVNIKNSNTELCEQNQSVSLNGTDTNTNKQQRAEQEQEGTDGIALVKKRGRPKIVKDDQAKSNFHDENDKESSMVDLANRTAQDKSEDNSTATRNELETKIDTLSKNCCDTLISNDPDKEIELSVQSHSSSQMDTETNDQETDVQKDTQETAYISTNTEKSIDSENIDGQSQSDMDASLNSSHKSLDQEVDKNDIAPVKKRGRPKKGKCDQIKMTWPRKVGNKTKTRTVEVCDDVLNNRNEEKPVASVEATKKGSNQETFDQVNETEVSHSVDLNKPPISVDTSIESQDFNCKVNNAENSTDGGNQKEETIQNKSKNSMEKCEKWKRRTKSKSRERPSSPNRTSCDNIESNDFKVHSKSGAAEQIENVLDTFSIENINASDHGEHTSEIDNQNTAEEMDSELNVSNIDGEENIQEVTCGENETKTAHTDESINRNRSFDEVDHLDANLDLDILSRKGSVKRNLKTLPSYAKRRKVLETRKTKNLSASCVDFFLDTNENVMAAVTDENDAHLNDSADNQSHGRESLAGEITEEETVHPDEEADKCNNSLNNEYLDKCQMEIGGVCEKNYIEHETHEVDISKSDSSYVQSNAKETNLEMTGNKDTENVDMAERSHENNEMDGPRLGKGCIDGENVAFDTEISQNENEDQNETTSKSMNNTNLDSMKDTDEFENSVEVSDKAKTENSQYKESTVDMGNLKVKILKYKRSPYFTGKMTSLNEKSGSAKIIPLPKIVQYTNEIKKSNSSSFFASPNALDDILPKMHKVLSEDGNNGILNVFNDIVVETSEDCFDVCFDMKKNVRDFLSMESFFLCDTCKKVCHVKNCCHKKDKNYSVSADEQELALYAEDNDTTETILNDTEESSSKHICYICGKQYKHKKSLRDHTKKRHPSESRVENVGKLKIKIQTLNEVLKSEKKLLSPFNDISGDPISATNAAKEADDIIRYIAEPISEIENVGNAGNVNISFQTETVDSDLLHSTLKSNENFNASSQPTTDGGYSTSMNSCVTSAFEGEKQDEDLFQDNGESPNRNIIDTDHSSCDTGDESTIINSNLSISQGTEFSQIGELSDINRTMTEKGDASSSTRRSIGRDNFFMSTPIHKDEHASKDENFLFCDSRANLPNDQMNFFHGENENNGHIFTLFEINQKYKNVLLHCKIALEKFNVKRKKQYVGNTFLKRVSRHRWKVLSENQSKGSLEAKKSKTCDGFQVDSMCISSQDDTPVTNDFDVNCPTYEIEYFPSSFSQQTDNSLNDTLQSIHTASLTDKTDQNSSINEQNTVNEAEKEITCTKMVNTFTKNNMPDKTVKQKNKKKKKLPSEGSSPVKIMTEFEKAISKPKNVVKRQKLERVPSITDGSNSRDGFDFIVKKTDNVPSNSKSDNYYLSSKLAQSIINKKVKQREAEQLNIAPCGFDAIEPFETVLASKDKVKKSPLKKKKSKNDEGSKTTDSNLVGKSGKSETNGSRHITKTSELDDAPDLYFGGISAIEDTCTVETPRKIIISNPDSTDKYPEKNAPLNPKQTKKPQSLSERFGSIDKNRSSDSEIVNSNKELAHQKSKSVMQSMFGTGEARFDKKFRKQPGEENSTQGGSMSLKSPLETVDKNVSSKQSQRSHSELKETVEVSVEKKQPTSKKWRLLEMLQEVMDESKDQSFSSNISLTSPKDTGIFSRKSTVRTVVEVPKHDTYKDFNSDITINTTKKLDFLPSKSLQTSVLSDIETDKSMFWLSTNRNDRLPVSSTPIVREKANVANDGASDISGKESLSRVDEVSVTSSVSNSTQIRGSRKRLNTASSEGSRKKIRIERMPVKDTTLGEEKGSGLTESEKSSVVSGTSTPVILTCKQGLDKMPENQSENPQATDKMSEGKPGHVTQEEEMESHPTVDETLQHIETTDVSQRCVQPENLMSEKNDHLQQSQNLSSQDTCINHNSLKTKEDEPVKLVDKTESQPKNQNGDLTLSPVNSDTDDFEIENMDEGDFTVIDKLNSDENTENDKSDENSNNSDNDDDGENCMESNIDKSTVEKLDESGDKNDKDDETENNQNSEDENDDSDENESSGTEEDTSDSESSTDSSGEESVSDSDEEKEDLEKRNSTDFTDIFSTNQHKSNKVQDFYENDDNDDAISIMVDEFETASFLIASEPEEEERMSSVDKELSELKSRRKNNDKDTRSKSPQNLQNKESNGESKTEEEMKILANYKGPFPPGYCFPFLGRGKKRCLNTRCPFKHRVPSGVELYHCCVKGITECYTMGDAVRAFEIYNSLLSLKVALTPRDTLSQLLKVAENNWSVMSALSLLDELNQQDMITFDVCEMLICMCGHNPEEYSQYLWKLFEIIMKSQTIKLTPDSISVLLRSFSNLDDYTYLWHVIVHAKQCKMSIVPDYLLYKVLAESLANPDVYYNYLQMWVQLCELEKLQQLNQQHLKDLINLFHSRRQTNCEKKLEEAAGNAKMQQMFGDSYSSAVISQQESVVVLNDTVKTTDNYKALYHKIQNCYHTKNWKLMGETFVELCLQGDLNNSYYIDTYAQVFLANLKKPAQLEKAFSQFIINVSKQYQEESQEDVLAKFDGRSLAYIGNRLLYACEEKKWWTEGYNMMNMMIKYSVPFYRYSEADKPLSCVTAINICLHVNDSNTAYNIHQHVVWDKQLITSLPELKWEITVLHELFEKLLVVKPRDALKVLGSCLDIIDLNQELNDHFDFIEDLNKLIITALDFGDLHAGCWAFKLHANAHVSQDLDRRTLRALLTACGENNYLLEAKELFKICKSKSSYPAQIIESPRTLHLTTAMTSIEIKLEVESYLEWVYRYLCDIQRDGVILDKNDFLLRVHVERISDPTAYKMPYLCRVPRTEAAAYNMVMKLFKDEFSMDGKLVFDNNASFIYILTDHVKKYLEILDANGLRQGFRVRGFNRT